MKQQQQLVAAAWCLLLSVLFSVVLSASNETTTTTMTMTSDGSTMKPQLMNPWCIPPLLPSFEVPAHFLFFIDRTIEASLQSRLTYLLKALLCEIPATKDIKLIVASYGGGGVSQFQGPETSNQVAKYLIGQPMEKDGSTSCDRFRSVLGRAPPAFLDHENVQFMVPMATIEPGCSLVKEFQNAFKSDPRKENFYFNGLSIDNDPKTMDMQAVRLVIPDIAEAVNPRKKFMKRNFKVGSAEERVINGFVAMMRDILKGNSERDWEEGYSTLIPKAVTTNQLPTSSRNVRATSEEEDDDDDQIEMFKLDGNDDYDDVDNSTDVVVVSSSSSSSSSSSPPLTGKVAEKSDKRTARNNATSVEPSSSNATTVISDETTDSEEDYVADYVPSGDYDPEEMELMRGLRKADDQAGEVHQAADVHVFPTAVSKWHWLEADTMIYILILLFIIWLFCLFACLAWMFHCAETKRDKLVDEQERQAQYRPVPVEPESVKEPSPPPPATKSSSTESDDSDDEWKNIKPAAVPEGAPKSETESVKQPPLAARYNPVEVSEFEDARNDEDFDERSQHGYVPPKKAPELQFD